jgi:general secretion pathway protein I
MFRFPTQQQGFSLLEVLVAFAILSLTLGALLQVFATGLRNTSLAEDYSVATLHAQSVLAILDSREFLNEGIEEGEIDATFSWRLSVMLWEDPNPPEETEADLREQNEVSEGVGDDEEFARGQVDPYQVTVEVFWEKAGRTRSVVLNTLRLMPQDDDLSL